MNREIFNTVRDGNIDKLKKMLESGENIHCRDEHGYTLLHTATGSTVEMLDYIVSQGADIRDRCTIGGTTAIHSAARYYNLDTLKYLVSKGLNANVIDDLGRTPLWSTVTPDESQCDIEIVMYLVSQGCNVNHKNFQGRTIIHEIAGSIWANITVLEYLIKKGANVNVKDEHGYTPLHRASELNTAGLSTNIQETNKNIMRCLISNGAKVNARLNYDIYWVLGGETPLDLASSEEKKLILAHAGGRYNPSDVVQFFNWCARKFS